MADLKIDGVGIVGASKGIHLTGVPKRFRKKVPDIDTDDEFYELFPDRLEEDLKTSPIPLIEHLKHFPFHNEDYSVWLDREFGEGREGFSEVQGLKDGTYRDYLEPLLDSIPDLTQWVRIRGKTHVRHIGVCTAGKAQDTKKLIANSSRIEPMMDKESQHWIKKDVRASVTEIKAEK